MYYRLKLNYLVAKLCVRLWLLPEITERKCLNDLNIYVVKEWGEIMSGNTPRRYTFWRYMAKMVRFFIKDVWWWRDGKRM